MSQITYTNKNIEFSTTLDAATAINELSEAFNLPAKITYKPHSATLIAKKKKDTNSRFISYFSISLCCSYCDCIIANFNNLDAMELIKNKTHYCMKCGSQFTDFINETGLIKDRDDPFD